MNTNTKQHLLQVMQDALKRHYLFFDLIVINAYTLRLHSPSKMYPVIEITDDMVVFTCPLAYYETESQRLELLELFENSRQVWYDKAGWGPFVGECNEPDARVERLPEDLVFKDNQTTRLISALLAFKPDYVLSNPDAFSSAVTTISWYPGAIQAQICEVIYKSMPKTITNPSDPKSYFLCLMLLFYRIHSNIEAFPWQAVDWEDVRTIIKISRQLIFYPSLSADSSDGLVKEMERLFRKDVSINEPFGIIVTLTLPQKYLSDYHNAPIGINNLRDRFGTNRVKTHIYVADDNHPCTAEMVLLKIKK